MAQSAYSGTHFHFSAVTTLRSFVEQQKEDYAGLARQLDTLERDMKALQIDSWYLNANDVMT